MDDTKSIAGALCGVKQMVVMHAGQRVESVDAPT
jgi:hypothetical protein